MATRDWVTRLKGVLDPSYTGTFGKAARNLETYRKNVFRVNAANDSLAKSSARASASSGSMSKAVFKGMVGFAATYVGVQQMGAAIKSVTQNTNERLAAEKRLQTLMNNVRGTTPKDIEQVKRLARAIQNYSTVGDDTAVHGASQLATYQLQSKSIQKLMPSLADLAVGTYGVNVSNEQMQQSANMLGKVFTGQVGVLRRVGISFDKHQEKILKTGTQEQKVAMMTKVIGQNYGNLAKQMANTPEGRVIQLKNAWGDFQEEIGLRVLPAVTKVLNWLGPKLPGQMAGGVKALDKMVAVARKIAPIFLGIWNGGSKTFNFLKKNWSWLGPIILGVAGAMAFWYGWMLATAAAQKILAAQQWLLNAAMTANPVFLLVLGIGILIGVIYALVKNWDKVVAALGRAWAWFVRFGSQGAGRFIPIVAIIALIAKNWDKITGAVKRAFGWIGRLIDKVKLVKPPKLWPFGGGGTPPAKHALGGIIRRPTLTWAGETGPEAIIPLANNRDRAVSLWRQTGAAIGAGAGASYTINVNVNAGAGQSPEGLRSAASDIAAEVKRVIMGLQDQERRRSFA